MSLQVKLPFPSLPSEPSMPFPVLLWISVCRQGRKGRGKSTGQGRTMHLNSPPLSVLQPGTYSVQYLVDGQWMLSPHEQVSVSVATPGHNCNKVCLLPPSSSLRLLCQRFSQPVPFKFQSRDLLTCRWWCRDPRLSTSTMQQGGERLPSWCTRATMCVAASAPPFAQPPLITQISNTRSIDP